MTTTSSTDARRVPRSDHRPRRRVPDLVGRLSRQSVEKGHDAYRDVPWDEPDHALSVDDPRVELFAFDPLTEHIMRIHVAEEARHIAYARTFLKDRVPELGPIHRNVLALAVPVVVSIMAPLMVEATMELHHRQGVPREAIREARRSSLGRQLRKDAAAKQRRLCRELGLMTGLASRVWKRLGYHDEDDQAGSVKPSK